MLNIITEPQAEFLRSLLKARVLPAPAGSSQPDAVVAGSSEDRYLRQAFDFLMGASTLSRSEASTLITWVKSLPAKEGEKISYSPKHHKHSSYIRNGRNTTTLDTLVRSMLEQTRSGGMTSFDYRSSDGKSWKITVARQPQLDR